MLPVCVDYLALCYVHQLQSQRGEPTTVHSIEEAMRSEGVTGGVR